MPRSREVVRQWQVLSCLAVSKLGLTVEAMAAEQAVTTRTIRRDLAALGRAGFPLFQEASEPPLRWKIDSRALSGLDAGFTLIELCALHFSRATLECLAGAPFHEELTQAFSRFERALPPPMRQFLDRLPAIVGVKQMSGRKGDLRRYRERIAQLLEASSAASRFRGGTDDLGSDLTARPAVRRVPAACADGRSHRVGPIPAGAPRSVTRAGHRTRGGGSGVEEMGIPGPVAVAGGSGRPGCGRRAAHSRRRVVALAAERPSPP